MVENRHNIQTRWGEKRYHSMDYDLKKRYGEKVYRIALDGGMTCPNRDGTIGSGGCIFCSANGSGDFAGSASCSVSEQLAHGKQLLKSKRPVHAYIAYFQAFTNTYAPVEYLEKIYMQAVSDPDVRILSIATRPDCLDEDILALLERINRIKPVWVELGLQTIHADTAAYIRRGYELPVFERAVNDLRARGIEVIVHTILCLPGETKQLMFETLDYLNHMDIQGIKLQASAYTERNRSCDRLRKTTFLESLHGRIYRTARLLYHPSPPGSFDPPPDRRRSERSSDRTALDIPETRGTEHTAQIFKRTGSLAGKGIS